jgi:hypothetical protein
LSCTDVPLETEVTTSWFALCASAHRGVSPVLLGGGLAPVPSVVRVSATADRDGRRRAHDRGAGRVRDSVIVQLPVAPTVVHGLVVNEPGRSRVKLIEARRRVHERAVAVLMLTCAVKTWLAPTGLLAVAGVIWMLASTS